MILFFLGWCLIQPQELTGAEALPVDLTELARSAELVLLADCIGVESRWNEKRTRIYTFARFQAVEKLKGSPQDHEVVVTFLGGTVGKISQVAVGLPQPVLGQRGLLFLSKAKADGARTLVGGAWGLLPIVVSAAGATLVALPNPDVLGAETGGQSSLPLPTLVRMIESPVQTEVIE